MLLLINRTKEEIIKSILEALPDRPTRIMQKANTDYTRLIRYLVELIHIGLIDFDWYHNRYHITERGKQYLAAVNELLVLQR